MKMKYIVYMMILGLLLTIYIPPIANSGGDDNYKSYYAVFHMNMRANGVDEKSVPVSFTMSAILLVNITFHKDYVEFITEARNVSMSYSSGTNTFTMSGSAAGAIPAKTSYNWSIDEYYGRMYKSFMGERGVSSLTSFISPSVSMHIRQTYEGIGSYKGLPVYKIGFEADYREGERVITGSGELYIHIGLMIPVYLNININAKGFNASAASFTMKFDIGDNNLPTTAVSGVEETDQAIIIAGGSRGAQITVSGSAGSNILVVENKGSEPGYVMIIEKTQSQTTTSSPTMHANPIIIGQNTVGNYVIVGVKPGEKKTVNLGFTLNRDVSITTENVSGGIEWTPILLLGIVLALTGAIIWIIHHILSRAKAQTITRREAGPLNEPIQ